MRQPIFTALVFLFLGLCTSSAWCDNEVESHERWYQVEILIFSRAETSHEEHWPTNIKLAYPTNLLSIRAGGEGDSAIVPVATGLLAAQAAAVARNPSYTTLFHQAWREKIVARKTHLLVTGGKTFNGHQELEGSISLSVGQYLKLQTNLWLTQFSPLGTNVVDNWPELPTLGEPNSDTNKTNNAVISRIVKITEQRSMRSNEVHYLDHPLLGIIVKIIPSN